MKLDTLFSPMKIGSCEIPNRLVVPAMVMNYCEYKPLTPPVQGIDGENVVFAEDVLVGNVEVSAGPVVVCGGGEVGCETAHYIADVLLPGVPVTVLEMQDQVLNDMMPFTKMVLLDMMGEAHVNCVTNATVKAIEADGVVYTDAEGNETKIPAGTVVSGFGYKAHNPLEEAACKVCDDVHVVGGAVKAGNALTAGKEAYAAAIAI